jgi:hypothetical protein
MKKLLIVLVSLMALPILIIIVAGVVLFHNQHRIAQQLMSEINEMFQGELVIDKAVISPFATFPYVSIDLKNVRYFDNKNREGKPMYEVSDLYVGFDIKEIFAGNYSVKALKLVNGHIDIVQFEDGKLSLLQSKNLYDMQREEADTGSSAFNFDLSLLKLKNIRVSHYNVSDAREAIADISKTKARLKMQNNQYYIDLESKLVLDLLENGTPIFFSNKRFVLDLELDFDSESQILNIIPSSVKLEEALFTLAGSVNLASDMDLDLTLTGEKPDFNVFAAFAPAEVAEILKRYRNAGRVYFNGTIQGKSLNGHTPALAVEFGCDNAYFLNTKFNKKVDEISFRGFYTNGSDRNLASSELRLQQFRAKPEEGIFEGTIIIRNFEDPYVKVNLHADLDLDFLGKFFQIEGLQRIRGKVLLDMNFDELIDIDLPGENLAQLKKGIDSELTIKNLTFLVPGYPHEVRNMNGHAIMRDGKIVMDKLRFNVGHSDFSFVATLSDFPALFHKRKEPVSFTLETRSHLIDLPELLSFDTLLAVKTDEKIKNLHARFSFDAIAHDLFNFKYLPKGEFFIDDFTVNFKNYPHTLHDFHADLIIEEDELRLLDFYGEIDSSDFHFSGVIKNYEKWFQDVKSGKSTFHIDLKSDKLKINDLLTYNGENYLPEDYRNEVFRDLKLKCRIDLNYKDDTLYSTDFVLENLNARMKVHPLKLENFKGRIHLKDKVYTAENFGGRMGNSDFKFDMKFYANPLPGETGFFRINSSKLDLDELMNFELEADKSGTHQDAFNIFDLPFKNIDFSASVGKLKYHTFWLENVELKSAMKSNHFIQLDTLGFRIADGTLGMTGYFNGTDSQNIYLNTSIRAEKLDLDKLLIKFENFGQDYFINENIRGKISGNINGNIWVYPDLTPKLESSEISMQLTIYDGALVKFAPMQALAGFFQDRNLNLVRFDTLTNTFTLKDGVITIPRMNINTSLGFLEFSGRQTLDMNMDYFVRLPLSLVTKVGFRALFGGRNREEVDPEQEDGIIYRDPNKRVWFVNVNMRGTPDDIRVSLGRDKNQK